MLLLLLLLLLLLSVIKQDTSITSSKDQRKKLKYNFFVKLIGSGVADSRHSNPPVKVYDTRQQEGQYVPSYFNYF